MNTHKQAQFLLPAVFGLGAIVAGTSTGLAQDEAKPSPTRWKTTAAVAATVTRGNSETVTATASINTAKKWSSNELGFGTSVTYGEQRDETTASSVTAYGQYNRLLTERFFGYARADVLHDDIARINYRITLSPGAGYYFIKNDKFTLNGEVGPGYVIEKFRNQDEEDYLTIRFAERFTWAITDTSRLWQSLTFSPKIDEWEDHFIEAEIGIATKITTALDLRVVANYTHRSEPAAGRKKDDFKLMAGVGYTF